MDSELKHIFVTVKARPEMSLFDWDHQVEEVIAAVSEAVDQKDWGSFQVYGPDVHGFSAPTLCLEADATDNAIAWLVNHVKSNIWLEPVRIYASLVVE